MNIAIDIDDTLTNSFDYFMPFVAEYFNVDINLLKSKNISYSNLPAQWKYKEIDFCKKYYDTYAPHTPFKLDATWGVNKLRELGHKIIIITGRTTAFYTDPYKTTIEELKNGNIAYDKLICTLDKAQACLDENISLLIDNMPGNCNSVIKNNIVAVLFTSKANIDEKVDYTRINNWEEAVKAVQQIERGYPDKFNALSLLAEAEIINPGNWINHSKVAAFCAQKIAKECSMNEEKAFVLGLLHDIGRKFIVKDLAHIYNGYIYMKSLGFYEVAKICLSHSFPNNSVSNYIGKIDISEDKATFVDTTINNMKFDDYDRLIQLCDALAGLDKAVNIEARMADVKKRYGSYPQDKWDKNIELKQYFENKTNKNIYDIVKGFSINEQV